MSSVQALRDFINERLTAAAGEIFSVFEQTIVQYEEEIDRQHELLQNRWKPQIIINKAEHVCEGRQPSSQETALILDQEESVPPQMKVRWEGTETPHIKEEQEEPEASQTRKDPMEPEFSQIHEEMKLESDTLMVTSAELSRFSAPEPDDEQLPPHDSAGADVGILEDGEHIDSGSTRCEELEPNRISVGGDVEDAAVSHPFSQNQRQKRLSREENCGPFYGTRHFLPNSGGQTNVKQYTCEVCGKTCSRKNNLLVHMRIHTGEKPYYCQTCGKSFKYQHYFLIHMRNHTGETPFTCNSCGKKFTNSSSLIKHRRIHSDKKHHCVTCGESFSQKAYLLTHVKLHTGEKPYSCERCGKGFSRRSNLVVHFRTHTGDQACYCAVCGRGFSSQSSLLVHVRHHTGEKPYSCETASVK